MIQLILIDVVIIIITFLKSLTERNKESFLFGIRKKLWWEPPHPVVVPSLNQNKVVMMHYITITICTSSRTQTTTTKKVMRNVCRPQADKSWLELSSFRVHQRRRRRYLKATVAYE